MGATLVAILLERRADRGARPAALPQNRLTGPADHRVSIGRLVRRLDRLLLARAAAADVDHSDDADQDSCHSEHQMTSSGDSSGGKPDAAAGHRADPAL